MRVRDIFTGFDTDGSGFLDAIEFQGALVELGIPRSLSIPEKEEAAIVQDVFNSFDVDGSGMIDFKELNKQLRSGRFDVQLKEVLQEGGNEDFTSEFHQKHNLRLREEWKALERFAEMDLDGSGAVSMRELHAFFSSEGYDDSFVEHLMAALDADASGNVDAEEWRAGVTLLRGSALLMSMTDPVEPPRQDIFMDLLAPRNVRAGGGFKHDRRKHVVARMEEVVLGKKGRGCTIEEPERRATLLSQLRAIVKHVERRCEKENWISRTGNRVTFPDVTQYDTAAYVTKPATRERKCALIEVIASEAQTPMWFVSHAWSESLCNLLLCLEQHARDRNLCMSTSAYWICAYALSPWKLSAWRTVGAELTSDTASSIFLKAMSVVQGTVSIIGDQAHLRTWVGFEVYHALKLAESGGHKYDVYTPKQHKLLGELISAPKQPSYFAAGHGKHEKDATAEKVAETRCAVGLTQDVCPVDRGAQGKALRESHFPAEQLLQLLKFRIEACDAAIEADKFHILNAIANDRALDGTPARSHYEYDSFNGYLRGRLAGACLSRCVDEGGALLDAVLEALAGSPLTELTLNFSHRNRLSSETVSRFMENMPTTLTNLALYLPPTITHVADDQLRKLRNMRSLDLTGCSALKELPSDIAELTMLQSLSLNNLGQLQNLPVRLFDLRDLAYLDLSGCSSLKEIKARGASCCALTHLTMKDCVMIEELPEPLGIRFAGLQALDLLGCTGLRRLPAWVADMEASGVAVNAGDESIPCHALKPKSHAMMPEAASAGS